MNLSLVKSEMFGSVQCDFWRDDHGEIVMTREQIGTALEYADPSKQIAKIHERYKERLNRFSGIVKLTTPGGVQETVVYYAKGIYEICRWSRQPKADEFYDTVYEILESLRRGDSVLMTPTDKIKMEELEIKRMNAEARLLNAKTRQALIVLKSKDGKTLSPKSVELLEVNALEVLTGQEIAYRPEVKGRHYYAEEIAKEAGVSKNKVGRVANQNQLKTDEFGMFVLDKSRTSDKQVEVFKYNEEGRAKLLDILRGA